MTTNTRAKPSRTGTTASPVSIAPIEHIIDALSRGEMVILVDDEHRENEGDLVIAAEFASPDAINFMATHGRGLICTPLTQERANALGLDPMVAENRDPLGTAFTVSVDARLGISTGISAFDRSATIATLIDKNAQPGDLVRPGHMFPLVARSGGVLARPGHTEASVELAELAGCEPAAVICEIMNDDGTMARLPELFEFAAQHRLLVGSIAHLVAHRLEQISPEALSGDTYIREGLS